jgi:hypothetical protein
MSDGFGPISFDYHKAFGCCEFMPGSDRFNRPASPYAIECFFDCLGKTLTSADDN